MVFSYGVLLIISSLSKYKPRQSWTPSGIGDLSPKVSPALRGVLGVKSLTLDSHFAHRLSLQEVHWR